MANKLHLIALLGALVVSTLTTILRAEVSWAQETQTQPRIKKSTDEVPGPPYVGIERVFSRLRFDRPVHLTGAGDNSDRVFVVEQSGIVRWFSQKDEVPTSKVFLDISDRVSRRGNEEGLIGFAFHPDFKNNGFVYCHYSSDQIRSGKNKVASNIIARFELSSDLNEINPNTEKVLMTIDQPFPNHNGGSLEFGHDGYLYLSLGDGGLKDDPFGNGQNISTLLGSILRIDINEETDGKPYSIPADNPFLNKPDARPEIYAIGLRNVWRFSFDRKTGELWAADVGQGDLEEVNIVKNGGNYGWNRYEANADFDLKTQLAIAEHDEPVAFYGRQWGGSITGGYVYRGKKFPELDGSYFFGDYMTGNLWRTNKDEEGEFQTELVRRTGRSIASFGEDDDGEVYLLSFDGGIYQIIPTDQPEDTFKNWPENLSETGLFNSLEKHVVADHLISYEVNAPFWSDHAEKNRFFILPEGTSFGYRAEGSWEVPVGATIVKNFGFSKGRNKRMHETRLIKRTAEGWEAATYVWDKKNTEAKLMTNGKQFEFRAAGGVKSWHAPSASECAACHVDAAGYVLGLSTAQLNRNFDDGSNQITKWATQGFVSVPSDLHLRHAPKFCSPFDETRDLETRARVWLDVNFAMCHRPKGPGNANIDLRFATTLPNTKTIDVPPAQGNLGITNAKLIDPGHPENSLMVHRIETLSQGRMPSIGSNQVDEAGVQLLSEWIKSLPR